MKCPAAPPVRSSREMKPKQTDKLREDAGDLEDVAYSSSKEDDEEDNGVSEVVKDPEVGDLERKAEVWNIIG